MIGRDVERTKNLGSVNSNKRKMRRVLVASNHFMGPLSGTSPWLIFSNVFTKDRTCCTRGVYRPPRCAVSLAFFVIFCVLVIRSAKMAVQRKKLAKPQ